MERQSDLDRWSSNSTNPSLKASGALWLRDKLERFLKERLDGLVQSGEVRPNLALTGAQGQCCSVREYMALKGVLAQMDYYLKGA